MNPFKILIAAVTIIIASNVLNGCSPQGVSGTGAQRIMEAQQFKKSVELVVREVESAEGISVEVLLMNPEKKAITSVQSWLSFNPQIVKGRSIDVSESAFNLTAPYDNTFDNEAGLAMVGRSSETPLEAEEILVARLNFERVAEGTVMLDAYDYTNDLSGHVSANTVKDETPYNLLVKPDSPILTIQ